MTLYKHLKLGDCDGRLAKRLAQMLFVLSPHSRISAIENHVDRAKEREAPSSSPLPTRLALRGLVAWPSRGIGTRLAGLGGFGRKRPKRAWRPGAHARGACCGDRAGVPRHNLFVWFNVGKSGPSRGGILTKGLHPRSLGMAGNGVQI